jgi:hypothetical protein
MQITVIVPQLLPAVDGVGDYALRLAIQSQQSFGILSQFIVGNPGWQDTGAIRADARADADAPFQAKAVSARTSIDLLTLLEQTVNPHSTLLLHYVPHGYATKACPFWLVQGLETWRRQHPKAQLLTFFHELYALDWHRPWSSDLWLSPIQQHLTGRLAQLSDACFTSTEQYVHQIYRLSQKKQTEIRTLPVFSNVGESTTVTSLSQRQRQLIIFGQRHSKGLVYQTSSLLLQQVCQALEINIILDIGPPTDFTPKQMQGIPIQELGKLPVAEISQILSQSLAGFMTYDPRRLGKSGIFAAYCAHGMLPINHKGLSYSTDGLRAGTHYWVPQPTQPLKWEQAQAIATDAHTWYQTHNLFAQAQVFHRYLVEQPLSLAGAR